MKVAGQRLSSSRLFWPATGPYWQDCSRGLSRRGKLKRQERDLRRLPTSFLSHMPSCFLNNQWRFCLVWHNPENRFEFERERERLLNLSARSNFKWTNQSWRWNDLASGPLQVSEESRRGEFQGKYFVLYESFDRRSTRSWSEIYWALWNGWFHCDSGLFFLRRKRFVEWRLASDGWSGFPANRGLSRRSRQK